MLLYILAATLTGVTIVTSRIINAKLAEKIGALQSTFFNYFVGLIISIIILFLSKEQISLFTVSINSSNFYMYFCGIVGVGSIIISNLITSKLSSFYLTLFIFIGQFFAGFLFDYLFTAYFSFGKLLGGVLVLIGLVYNLYIDKKEMAS